MKKIFSTLLFLFLFVTAARATNITGTVTFNNIAIANGSVQFTLLGCADPLVNSSVGNPAVQNYTFTLDANGNFPSGSVTGNDIIYCSGIVGATYYQLEAFNAAGGLLWNRYYRITGSLWNIATATVLTNFSISTFVLTNPPGDQIISNPPNNRLTIAGGLTLINNLQLGQDPTVPTQAATKNYVDNAISGVNTTALNLASKLSLTGGVMTGPLILAGDPTLPLGASTKQYVDNSIASAIFSIGSGDCVGSSLTINFVPLASGNPCVLTNSPIDNGLTISGNMTVSLPWNVAPTDGNNQPSEVIGAETNSSTADIFDIDNKTRSLNYLSVAGPGTAHPGELSITGLVLRNLLNAPCLSTNSSGVVGSTTCGALTGVSFGSWPSYLTPSVTGTAVQTITVAGSQIPNSALANSSIPINGTTCTLGSSCTISAPGGISSVPTTSQSVSQPAGTSFIPQTVNTTSGSPVNAFGTVTNNSGPGHYWNSGSWNSSVAMSNFYYSNTPGIDHLISANFTNETSGDTALLYAYMLAYCGQHFGSDEGCQFIKGQPFQVGRSTAIVATPGIGTTTGAYGAAPGGSSYIYLGAVGGKFFPINGTLETISLPSSTSGGSPTAQTATAFIFTPVSAGVINITTTFPLTILHTGTTQIYHNGIDFAGVVPAAGQGLGIYFPSGIGTATSSQAAGCFTGAPTIGTVTYSTTACGEGIELQATQAAPATGSTQLAFSNFGCFALNLGCSGQSQYGWTVSAPLLDLQTVQTSTAPTAAITGRSTVMGARLTYTVSGTTFPISTAWGSIISCPLTVPANNQTYVSLTCVISLGTSPVSPGNFVVGSEISLAGVQAPGEFGAGGYEEESEVTAVTTPSGGQQSVTFLTNHPWAGSSQGAQVLVMQGGPQSQFAVLSSNLVGNYWPIAYKIIGSFTSTQIVLGNCETGDCQSLQNAPANREVGGLVSLTRTGNVVSAAPSPFILNVTNFPVGSTAVISECTVDTDLNGSFVVTVSSMDNVNPILQWTQTGANEGPDTTCELSAPPTQLTFVPGAFIIGSLNTSQATVGTNQVSWVDGDYVTVAPTSQYAMTGLALNMGQASPGGQSSGINIVDNGPSPMLAAISVSNTSNFGAILPTPAQQAQIINGNYLSDFTIKYEPANNGAIINDLGFEPMTSSAKPLYLYINGTSGHSIMIDKVNNVFNFNRGIVDTGAPSQFGAGSSVGGSTNLICTYDGTTARNCPTANIATGPAASILQYVTGSTIGPVSNWFNQGGSFLINNNGFKSTGSFGFQSVNNSSGAVVELSANLSSTNDLYFNGADFEIENLTGVQRVPTHWSATTGDMTVGGSNDCSSLFAVGTGCHYTLDANGNSVQSGTQQTASTKTAVYTVSTLPSASSLTAGTIVTVSDDTGLPTSNTCTGGGSGYAIAITNGSTWSCH